MSAMMSSAPLFKRISEAVKAQSSRLNHSSPLQVYQVPLEEEQIHVSGCRRYRFGDDFQKSNRTIMVMGATGSGKSTLIDGMINYILGVRQEDEYRFKLVKETQAESHTSEVTVYKLNHRDGFQIDHSLTIIDTPGFGDTGGIKRDMEITEMIRNLFTSTSGQVFKLDLVCFIVQSALARLTPSQRYVFVSVLSIFGKDIKENIRVLVTFADEQRPPVLETITASGAPCPQEKGAPLHFKFNNSALFANNKSATDDYKMSWKMGIESMQSFFVALNQIQTKSLTLTKEVLYERKQVENLVDNLQKQVRVGLCKLDEIKQKSEILKTHEAEIRRNENFEFEVTVPEVKRVDLSGKGIYTTNCRQCNNTCHDNCAYSDNKDKINCCAMSNGYCTVCPGKCRWDLHVNQPFRWEHTQVKKKETVKELKEKYEKATGQKYTVEAVMKNLEDEYEAVQVEVTVLIDRSSVCLNRLKEIALKPDPLSTPDYIDMLIEGEEAEAKPGWKNRVDSLMAMKERAETMAKVQRGETVLEKGQRVTQKETSFWSNIKAGINKVKERLTPTEPV